MDRPILGIFFKMWELFSGKVQDVLLLAAEKSLSVKKSKVYCIPSLREG